MNCFIFQWVLLVTGCLLVISCDSAEPDPESDFAGETETARIEAELCLMNLSKEVKSPGLAFGNGNAHIRMEDDPVQVIQVHEKTFYLGPKALNPRFLMMGKIRIKICRKVEVYNTDGSPPKMSDDISQQSDFNPQ